jgi:hypothetical protein
MELIGGILLFIVTVCWIGFIGFIFFGICALIYFALEDAFDGFAVSSGDHRNWRPDSERVNRYWALLKIRWLLWRANRRLEYQAKLRGRRW